MVSVEKIVVEPSLATIVNEGEFSVRDRRQGHRRNAPLDILLLDAQYRQGLVMVRALGREGYSVGAAISASDSASASCLRSRWCDFGALLPALGVNASAYTAALLRVLDEYPTRVLVPGLDGSIEVVRAHRDEFERRARVAMGSEEALRIATNKDATLAIARQLGIATPRGVNVSSLDELPAALREVGTPAVIKPMQSWVSLRNEGARLTSELVTTVDEAKKSLDYMLRMGGSAIVQQWLPGKREAVSLFYAQGQFLARFAQVSYREFPPLGGASTLCESIPLLPDITDAAEHLIRAIDLEGCSMVEFRRDCEGRPVLMEINPRIAGSVALAINAGVNFPTLLSRWALGEPLPIVADYRVGARLRWLGGDIWNFKSLFDSQGHPDVPPLIPGVATFFSDFICRPSVIDSLDISDLKPSLAELQSSVMRPIGQRIRRVVAQASTRYQDSER